MHEEISSISNQRLLGQLIAKQDLMYETIKNQSRNIEDLMRSVVNFEHKLNKLSDGLEMANQDIMSITHECITAEKLRSIGIDMLDHVQHKLDMEHLRDLREHFQEKKSFWTPVRTGFAIAFITALFSILEKLWLSIKSPF